MTGLQSLLWVFLTIPLGHALMSWVERGAPAVQAGCAIAMFAVGVWIMRAAVRLEDDREQSLLGVAAGVLIWTGGVEFGMKFAAFRLGIGSREGTLGMYVLLEQTWPFLAVLLVGLVFHPGVRCAMMISARRRLGLARGEYAPAPPINYAPRTALEYVGVTWTGYVLLLLLFDPRVAGPRHVLTTAGLWLFCGGGGWLLRQLLSIRHPGRAVRYAVPTAVTLWAAVEILVKRGLLEEPWVTLDPVFIAALLAGFVAASLVVSHPPALPTES